ncbi:MAG: SpoIIE family protein phosphatase [Alphaproteobacteria bacterium]|jgi:serine/threonine protein phosphatase PrpC|nr:SpoIIE family protein phosphatase [Alphaproteobacteria bacterium]
MLKAIAAMHIGQRSEQQDCILVDARVSQSSDMLQPIEIPVSAPMPIIAVCDGVGGGPSGGEASRTACETLAGLANQLGPNRSDLLWLIERLQSRMESLCMGGSGTTIAGVAVDGHRVRVFHAGDSRVYKIGKNGGRLMTRDHVGPSLSLGETSSGMRSKALNFGLGPVFRQAWRTGRLQADCIEDTFEVGDAYLLCTDGLNETTGIGTLLTMAGIPNEERLGEIMKRAEQTAHDNIAVCVVSFATAD